MSITPSNVSLVVGQTQTLKINPFPSDASRKVTWSVENEEIATISNSGIITARKNGTTIIRAVSQENANITATATVTVKDIKDISLSGQLFKTTYYDGESVDSRGMKVTAIYTDNTTSTIDNENCEWLDGNTRKSTLSLGTTSIICKFGKFEKTINGITVIQSQGGTMTIDSGSFSYSTTSYGFQNWTSNGVSGKAFVYPGAVGKLQFNTGKGGHYLFNTTQIPGNIKTITVKMSTGSKDWEIRTSSESFGEVSNAPKTGTDCGTKTVTTEGVIWDINSSDRFFTLNYEDTGVAYIDSVVIDYGQVLETPDNIILDKETAELIVGEEITLVPTATSDEIIWKTSDESVATVSNGIVRGHKAGNCTITAIVGEASATCQITVYEKSDIGVTNITLSENSHSLKVEESFTLQAIIEPINATNKNVVWSSSNSEVATVNNGVVTAHSVGSSTITVSSLDGNHQASCQVTVVDNDVVIKIDDETISDGIITINENEEKSLLITSSTGDNINVTFESENPDIVEITEDGQIIAKAKGTAIIKITDENGNVTTLTINVKEINNGNSDKNENNDNNSLTIVLIAVGVVLISGSVGTYFIIKKKRR